MCEPSHSVVQYNDRDPDDDNLPHSGQMTLGQRLSAALGEKIVSWGKKIRGFFHFSRLGSGHTDAISLTGRASLILPEHTRYEGHWWDRKFVLDGSFNGAKIDAEDALKCAEQYHNQVVMVNMSTFRRFLETSMLRSTREWSYAEMFLGHVLTANGRDQAYRRLKSLFEGRDIRSIFEHHKVQAIKVLMGFTRQRKLFLPHWADDDRMWNMKTS